MRRLILAAGMFIAVLVAVPAGAWWDTIVKNWRYPPLVETWNAADLTDANIVEDELSIVGRAVSMEEGGPALTVSRELIPSVYGVYVYGRSPREEDVHDPGNMPPFYLHFKITNTETGASETHRIRAAYMNTYMLTYGSEDMLRCFFRVIDPGDYSIEIATGHGSTGAPVWVDRIEIRDVLGDTARARGKTSRNMISDEDLANLRGGELQPIAQLPADRIFERCNAYWDSFPPANAPRHSTAVPGQFNERDQAPTDDMLTGWRMNALDQPWILSHPEHGEYTIDDYLAHRPVPGPLADDGWGVTVPGMTVTWNDNRSNSTFAVVGPQFRNRVQSLVNLMLRKAQDYEQTGNSEAGLEGAAILLAFAHHYPMLDFRTQASWPGTYGRFSFANHMGGGIVEPGLREGHAVSDYMRAYDRLYDFIAANPGFAEFMNSRIDSVENMDDLIEFLDINLVQRTADVIMRGDAAGDPLKMSRALVITAICQGVNDISQEWVDIICDEIPMGMIEPGGLEDMAIGDLGRDGLVSKGSGGYSKGSIMSFLEVTTSLNEYREAGGNVPVDLTDFDKYPWFRDALYAPINLRIAGGWVPLLGDYGDPLRTREVFFDTGPTRPNSLKDYYLEAWRLTGDPKFAFLTHRYGRTTEDTEEWAEITDQAADTRDPLYILPPRVLDSLGLAILETGQEFDDYTRKRAATLRYGLSHTHGHNDGLDLALFAKGMRAITDLAARSGVPNPRLQKMHNTVEVDLEGMNNGDDLAAGWGWLNAFAPMGDVQYMNASQRARSHPQLEVYRRGAAMIDVGEDDSYIFDVFRVAGGTVHTWCAHANQNDSLEMNAELAPATSDHAVAYLQGFKNEDTPLDAPHMVADLLPQPMEGVAPEALVATWRLHPRAETAFLGRQLPEDERIFARWRLFGREGDRLFAANGYSQQYRYDMSFLYVQRPDAGPEGTVYPALAEIYQGQPVVQSARMLPVADGGTGAERTVAMEIALPDGVTDICLSGLPDGQARPVEGGITFDGLFGMVRRDGQGLARVDLVGGSVITGEGFNIRPARPEFNGTVVQTMPDENACIVEGDFDGVDMVNRLVLLVSPDGQAYAYTVTSVEPIEDGRAVVRLKEKMKIFQSVVEHVDEEARTVSVVAEPYDLKAHQRAYDNSEVSNESLSKRWNSHITCDSRWMKVKTPVREEDIPDADGDGIRSLRLIGSPQVDGDRAGETLLTIEVTRVDEDNDIFYFNMPPDPYDIGGWDYVRRDLVSENGKRWKATYPGFEYKVVVEDDVSDADFYDDTGDGRATLSLYRFRAGYQMVMPSFASLVRTAPGEYRLESNVACEVRAPGKVTRE